MMQKEGLECGEREFLSCHPQQGRDTSRVLGLLAELEHWLHLQDMFGRKGGAAAVGLRCCSRGVFVAPPE